MELPPQVYDGVAELSRAGSALFESANYSAALDKWKEVLDLIPEPSRSRV